MRNIFGGRDSKVNGSEDEDTLGGEYKRFVKIKTKKLLKF